MMDRKRLYYKNVSLKNIRTFGKKQTINFCDEAGEPNLWNIIIGDNGIGKTTILKTLSLPLISPWGNRNWLYKINFNTFNRYSEKKKSNPAYVDIEFVYGKEEKNKLKLELLTDYRNGDINVNHLDKNQLYTESFLLFAYGASRQIGQKGISSDKEFPAQTLFDDKANLMNTEEWLLQVELKSEKNSKFKLYKEKVFEIVKQLLQGEVTEIKTDVENSPKILFKTKFGWVRLHELSLGYKTLLSWIVDFAKGMMEKHPKSDNPLAEPAICLVDEIDLHIHPALQKKVINFLKNTFSKTQFIVTTHSPLILQSVENANVILLKEKGTSVEVHQNILDIKNWRTDQVLMSDLFDLKDVYPLKSQQKIDRHEELLRKHTLTSKEEKELESLTVFVEKLPIGNGQKEIEGFEILRKFAKKIAQNQEN